MPGPTTFVEHTFCAPDSKARGFTVALLVLHSSVVTVSKMCFRERSGPGGGSLLSPSPVC